MKLGEPKIDDIVEEFVGLVGRNEERSLVSLQMRQQKRFALVLCPSFHEFGVEDFCVPDISTISVPKYVRKMSDHNSCKHRLNVHFNVLGLIFVDDRHSGRTPELYRKNGYVNFFSAYVLYSHFRCESRELDNRQRVAEVTRGSGCHEKRFPLVRTIYSIRRMLNKFLPDMGISSREAFPPYKEPSQLARSPQHRPNLLAPQYTPLSIFDMVTLANDGASSSSPLQASLGMS